MSDSPLPDYREIDDIIHGRARLAIMAYLSGVDRAEFGRLRDKTGSSDGNLSVNLRKLEDAGYVIIDKSFVDRRPLTTISLSPAGRGAWIAYLDRMRALLFDSGSLPPASNG